MSSMKTDYEIPVSKNTVDKMMENLIKENERLSRENQELTEKLNQTGGGQEGQESPDEMAKAIGRYMD